MADNPFNTLLSPEQTNEIVENVLLITLDDENPKNLFVMSGSDCKLWTMETMEINLFERLMCFSGQDDEKVILYLYESFLRLQQERAKSSNEVTEFLKEILIRNVAVSMKQPELFAEQNVSEQIIKMFKDYEENLQDSFLSQSIKKAFEDTDDSMKRNIRETIWKCFDECLISVRQATMISLEKWILRFLQAFVSDKNNPEMAGVFLDFITLPPICEGIKYADSLLGKLTMNFLNHGKDLDGLCFRSASKLVNNSKDQPRSLRILRQFAELQRHSFGKFIVNFVELSQHAPRRTDSDFQRILDIWRCHQRENFILDRKCHSDKHQARTNLEHSLVDDPWEFHNRS